MSGTVRTLRNIRYHEAGRYVKSDEVISSCRRIAATATRLGDPDDCDRPDHVGDGRRDRQRGVAHYRARPPCEPRLLDLDRQRLSARDHDLAVAAGFARRNRRLSPRLHCGAALFTLASLFCVLAHTLTLLTIARILQGFGAAGIMSVNMALVRHIYPRARLGRGIGINAMVVAVSAAVGPTIAAGILAIGPWPYLFAINIPLGLGALADRHQISAVHQTRGPRLRLDERSAQRRRLWARPRRDRQHRP